MQENLKIERASGIHLKRLRSLFSRPCLSFTCWVKEFTMLVIHLIFREIYYICYFYMIIFTAILLC